MQSRCGYRKVRGCEKQEDSEQGFYSSRLCSLCPVMEWGAKVPSWGETKARAVDRTQHWFNLPLSSAFLIRVMAKEPYKFLTNPDMTSCSRYKSSSCGLTMPTSQFGDFSESWRIVSCGTTTSHVTCYEGWGVGKPALSGHNKHLGIIKSKLCKGACTRKRLIKFRESKW